MATYAIVKIYETRGAYLLLVVSAEQDPLSPFSLPFCLSLPLSHKKSPTVKSQRWTNPALLRQVYASEHSLCCTSL